MWPECVAKKHESFTLATCKVDTKIQEIDFLEKILDLKVTCQNLNRGSGKNYQRPKIFSLDYLIKKWWFCNSQRTFKIFSSVCDNVLKTNLSSLFRLLPMPSPLVWYAKTNKIGCLWLLVLFCCLVAMEGFPYIHVRKELPMKKRSLNLINANHSQNKLCAEFVWLI